MTQDEILNALATPDEHGRYPRPVTLALLWLAFDQLAKMPRAESMEILVKIKTGIAQIEEDLAKIEARAGGN